MPNNHNDVKLPFEVTSEEATLLSAAASSWANEYRRSLTRNVVPELKAVWIHNERVLRDLSIRLARLAKPTN